MTISSLRSKATSVKILRKRVGRGGLCRVQYIWFVLLPVVPLSCCPVVLLSCSLLRMNARVPCRLSGRVKNRTEPTNQLLSRFVHPSATDRRRSRRSRPSVVPAWRLGLAFFSTLLPSFLRLSASPGPLALLSSSLFLLSVALRVPFNDRDDQDDLQFNNVHDRRIRSPIHPQAIPFHLASHILSTSCSTYYCPHLYRLPNQRCHHRRSRPRHRCKEHPPSKLSSRGACSHRWRISTSFLGRACKRPNDQCSPWNHGRRTHRVDSQVSNTFPLSQHVDEYILPA
jgi:hypothetical protein